MTHVDAAALPASRPKHSAHALVGTIVFVVILLVAAWLRLRVLSLKPLHSDEGVNGWFLMNLYEGLSKWNMRYKYDPTNYHGPFLYFAGLIPFVTLGPTNMTLRLLPALAGIACVGALWPVRRWLGWAGLATAAALLALSPPFVYFSRTAIHEIYVFFFSLLAVVCFVRSFAGSGPADGPRYRPNWLLGAFVSAAIVFTNKETAVITFAAFGAASVVAWFLGAGRGSWPRRFRELVAMRPRGKAEWNDWGLAFAWAAAITVILFTSFFNHPRGAWDMFATYGTWVGRGHEGAGHDKPFRFWIDLMWSFDTPILVLGLAGTVAALWRRDRFSLFVATWTWFLWLVYSVISYKTPWLNLNFTGPMCLLGGIAVRELAVMLRARPAEMALAVAVPVVIAVWPVPAGPVISAERGAKTVMWADLMWDVNYRHADDDRYSIIYVQTVRDFEAMVSRLDALFAAHGEKLAVWVTSGDYWPLPYYMRHHNSLGYHQGKIPAGPTPAVVIASSTQEAELRARLFGYRQEQFMLRPGVVLTMSVEPAIWDPVFGAPEAVALPAPAPADWTQMKPGLVAEFRYGIGCTGDVLARRVEAKPTYGGAGKREFRAPVCATWRGFVKIEQEGEVAFGTSSDDGSWVWVDGELAIDNGGTHGPTPRTGVLRAMKPGLHPIEVRYFDAGGGAQLEVFAKQRGGVDFPLDGRLLHAPDPPAANL